MPDFEFNEEKPDSEQASRTMNPKVVFGSILFFGVCTLLFGSFKIWDDIRTPSLGREEGALGTVNAFEQLEAGVFSPADPALKNKDSDSDGLNDWDELNVYHTSPYLKDSDGDGYDDNAEVTGNEDPNCPRGQSCSAAANATAEEELFNDLAPSEGAAPTPAPVDLANLTPQQLRELLLATGQVTADQLEQVDDATLMELYRDTLSSEAAAQPPQ